MVSVLNQNTILAVISISIALFALIISYRTFLRQRTFENENHYFKYKFDKFNIILSYIASLLYNVEGKIDEYFSLSDGDNEEEIIEDELDAIINKAELELLGQSAFIPEEVFMEIERFMDKLIACDFLSADAVTIKYDSEISKLDKLSDRIFVIAEEMRKDLGIDTLNIQLLKRTHRGANTK